MDNDLDRDSDDSDEDSGNQGDKGYNSASSEIKDIQMSEVSSDEHDAPAQQTRSSSGKFKQRSKQDTRSQEKLAQIMEEILQVMKDRGNDCKPRAKQQQWQQRRAQKSTIDDEVQVMKRTEPAAIRNAFLVCVLLLLRILTHSHL